MGNESQSSSKRHSSILSIQNSYDKIQPLKSKEYSRIRVQINQNTFKLTNHPQIKNQIKQIKVCKMIYFDNNKLIAYQNELIDINFNSDCPYLKQDKQIRVFSLGLIKTFWSDILLNHNKDVSFQINFKKIQSIKTLSIENPSKIEIINPFLSPILNYTNHNKILSFCQQNQKISSQFLKVQTTLPRNYKSYYGLKHLCLKQHQSYKKINLLIAKKFFQSLSTSAKTLQTLILQFKLDEISRATAGEIITYFSKLNNLENLNFNVTTETDENSPEFQFQEQIVFPKLKFLKLRQLDGMSRNDPWLSILGEPQVQLPNLDSYSLVLSDNTFQSFQCPELGKLDKKMIKIKYFDLKVWFNSVDRSAAKFMFANLNSFKLLYELKIDCDHCKLDSQYISYLTDPLSKLKELKKLVFILKDNLINADSAKRVGQALSNLCQIEYLRLDLSLNNIQNYGLLAINKGICELKGLKELDLDLSQQGGFSKLNDKMFYNFSELQILTIRLQYSNYEPDFIEFLGQSIGEITNLQQLKLNFASARIRDQKIIGIVQYLHQLDKLFALVLLLEATSLTNESVSQICKNISLCGQIIFLKLDFSRNEIQREALQGALQHLSQCQSLENLKLSFQFCYVLSCYQLNLEFSKFKKIKDLELDLDRQVHALSANSLLQLSHALRQCKPLESLKLYLQKSASLEKISCDFYEQLSSIKKVYVMWTDSYGI